MDWCTLGVCQSWAEGCEIVLGKERLGVKGRRVSY